MPDPCCINLIIVQALRYQDEVCETEIHCHSNHGGNEACPERAYTGIRARDMKLRKDGTSRILGQEINGSAEGKSCPWSDRQCVGEGRRGVARTGKVGGIAEEPYGEEGKRYTICAPGLVVENELGYL